MRVKVKQRTAADWINTGLNIMTTHEVKANLSEALDNISTGTANLLRIYDKLVYGDGQVDKYWLLDEIDAIIKGEMIVRNVKAELGK